MRLKVFAIAAMDEGRVIGRNNQVPWHVKEDMRRFFSLTRGHTVIMGRKTLDSLPPKFKPLPERKNVVLSRSGPEGFRDGVCYYGDLKKCLEAFQSGSEELQGEILWIIGGEQIYRESLPYWDELYLTVVHSKHQGDAYFPQFEDSFELVEEEQHPGYSFLRYRRS